MISPCSATRTVPLNCPRSNRVDISLSISALRSGDTAWTPAHQIHEEVKRRIAVRNEFFGETGPARLHIELITCGMGGWFRTIFLRVIYVISVLSMFS